MMSAFVKTVEAGLVLREMLLRRRVDYAVVSSPAAMTVQWQDELAQKFGLSFAIVDRDYLAAGEQKMQPGDLAGVIDRFRRFVDALKLAPATEADP